ADGVKRAFARMRRAMAQSATRITAAPAPSLSDLPLPDSTQNLPPVRKMRWVFVAAGVLGLALAVASWAAAGGATQSDPSPQPIAAVKPIPVPTPPPDPV